MFLYVFTFFWCPFETNFSYTVRATILERERTRKGLRLFRENFTRERKCKHETFYFRLRFHCKNFSYNICFVFQHFIFNKQHDYRLIFCGVLVVLRYLIWII